MVAPTQEELDTMVIEAVMTRHATKVRELRFSKDVKLVKRTSAYGPSGWMLLVEGVAGGTAMDFSDGFLYHTQGCRSGRDPFKEDGFFTQDIADAVRQAEALVENLNGRRIVEPNEAFISRFLNPVSFERQRDYWASNECSVGAVLAR